MSVPWFMDTSNSFALRSIDRFLHILGVIKVVNDSIDFPAITGSSVSLTDGLINNKDFIIIVIANMDWRLFLIGSLKGSLPIWILMMIIFTNDLAN